MALPRGAKHLWRRCFFPFVFGYLFASLNFQMAELGKKVKAIALDQANKLEEILKGNNNNDNIICNNSRESRVFRC